MAVPPPRFKSTYQFSAASRFSSLPLYGLSAVLVMTFVALSDRAIARFNLGPAVAGAAFKSRVRRPSKVGVSPSPLTAASQLASQLAKS